MPPIIKTIIGYVLEKIFTNKEESDSAKQKLNDLDNKGELAVIADQAQVLLAEINNESWLTKSWRPITMLSFLFIILNHYFLMPMLNYIFNLHIPNPEIPSYMVNLMEIGIGGYMVGHCGLHIVNAIKRK